MIRIPFLSLHWLFNRAGRGERAVVLATPTTNDITPHPKVKRENERMKRLEGALRPWDIEKDKRR